MHENNRGKIAELNEWDRKFQLMIKELSAPVPHWWQFRRIAKFDKMLERADALFNSYQVYITIEPYTKGE
jgi:hypothetical protein